MARESHSEPETNTCDRQRNAPAIGLVATSNNADTLAGNILRAKRKGYTPLVIKRCDSDAESVNFARTLNADPLEPDTFPPTDSSLRENLVTVARKYGHPGLIYQGDPTAIIDIERSVSALADTNKYTIPGQTPDEPVVTGNVLVAIPAYNEIATIADVVTNTQKYVNDVVVVDDGSDDETAVEARAAGAIVVSHRRNSGYGASIKTACEFAYDWNIEVLVTIDGDGQHDPTDIPRLISKVEDQEADIAIGSRNHKQGKKQIPIIRRVGLLIINSIMNVVLGQSRDQRTPDTQSGYRAYGYPVIESLVTDAHLIDGMGVSTDSLFHARKEGFEIVEIPTTIEYDGKDSPLSVASHGFHLLRNIYRTVEREHPITILGVPGMVIGFIGLGFGYWTTTNFLRTSTFPLGLAITATLFTVVGIFTIFTSLILHATSNE